MSPNAQRKISPPTFPRRRSPSHAPMVSRVSLYRMPQLEPNKEGSFTLLMHAAPMRTERVPREITFSLFVAIAEVAMRYRCTSPLELFVEHRWLPQWVHMAQVDMPDGLVVISCAFGLRTLFTRVTKTVIMNLVDEQELMEKNWPHRIKEKIWNVRCAKTAQVYACCAAAVEEYLRPPNSSGSLGQRLNELDGSVSSHIKPDGLAVQGRLPCAWQPARCFYTNAPERLPEFHQHPSLSQRKPLVRCDQPRLADAGIQSAPASVDSPLCLESCNSGSTTAVSLLGPGG